MYNNPINYTKVYKEINIQKSIKKTLENKDILQADKIRIRNILLCTFKLADWRYISETFRIKKREEFYGMIINKEK